MIKGKKIGLLSIVLAFAMSVGTLVSCVKNATTTSSIPLGGILGLAPGQVITTHAKLTGDVEIGTTLYIYDIQ